MATTNVPEFISKIDWSELRNQKHSLINLIDEIRKSDKNLITGISIPKDIDEDLDGILNLIDALQDYAVDTAEIVKAVDVYDFEVEEDRDE